jgi:uncharacterized damage-inducible protein DinB
MCQNKAVITIHEEGNRMQANEAEILRDFLLPQIENEWRTTKKVIAAIPEDQREYSPEPKVRNAFDLAWHIAATEVWFIDGIIKGEFKMEEGEGRPEAVQSVADVIAWYDKAMPGLVERLKALPPEDLAKPVSFLGVLNEAAVAYLNLLIVHSVHHRGQLSTYLRPMGSKVPAIYGGSADEPFEMAAEA